VYVQWVAGSATAAADVVAEAEAEATGVEDDEGVADAEALGFGAGVPPVANTAIRPPMSPRTQTTARPMPNR
jgi:hypothetical protein